MLVQLKDTSIHFKFDDEREQHTAEFSLPAWSGYRSENSVEELSGENVLFLLESESYETHPELASPESYSRAMDWFIEHQDKVRDSAMSAICGYIDVLRNEYGIKDEELDAFTDAGQLANMIDVSYVHFYPQMKNGEPYFALELECNWDPEHGCGIMFHGSRVVDIGGSDVTQGAFDISADGGKI